MTEEEQMGNIEELMSLVSVKFFAMSSGSTVWDTVLNK